jgi:hypothetical protein
MSHECTQERFLRDVSDHVMTVIRDDGVSRHIQFRRPGTGCYHFDLITWPGALCYTSDMGTYVFRRLTDMFEFFRTDREQRRDPSKLAINLGYWTEKLVAIDGSRNGGKCKEFDADKFRRVINEYRVQWMRDAQERGLLDKDERRELWEEVDDEVLSRLEDGEHYATTAAYEFSWKARSETNVRQRPYQFDGMWDHDFTEYTHSIVWCCYALAWGIAKYDAAKQAVEEVATC